MLELTNHDLSQAERLANALGKKVEVVDNLADHAGNALGVVTDAQSGKVLISTGKEGYGATRNLIAGGMTESLGKSGQYEAFRDAVLKSIPEDELVASVTKFQNIYGNNNPVLIEREVVNEWVSNNLYNSYAIKQIASADPQLANGVREYLGGLKTKLSGMDGMQAVGREIEQAEGMWERAGRNEKRITLDTLNGNEYDGISESNIEEQTQGFGGGSKLKNAKCDKGLEDTAKISSNEKLNEKHRISYKDIVDTEMDNFIGESEHRDHVDDTMILVQFHRKKMLGDRRSAKYWIPLENAKDLKSIEEVKDRFALLDRWGDRDIVSIAAVPKDTYVDYIIGKAKMQTGLNEIRPGGGLQVLFEEFDPDWITEVMTAENFFKLLR